MSDHPKCSRCSRGRPTLYLQEAGETQSLCKACVKTLGIDAGSIDGVCRGFASGQATGSSSSMPFDIDMPDACPNCGTKIRDVLDSRQVGCEKCFDTFEGVIRMLLPDGGSLDDPADQTHRDLHDALRQQRYEYAAKLRDIINGTP